MTGFTDDRRAPHVKRWRLSPTAGELWNACPQAFSYQYELGVEEVAGRPLRVGRLMAMTIEKYLLHCFEHHIASDVTEIDAIARKVYAEEGVGVGLDALEEVLRICSYYVQGHALDLDRLAGVEVWLPPATADPLLLAGRELIGKVDELYFDDEGRLAIVRDAKTNWSVWSDQEAREKLQAKIYPILIAHAFPEVEEIEVIFDFVRWPGAERGIHWTRGELDIELQNLEALAVQMQKPGKRPATPGDHCSMCGYTELCPRFKSAKDSKVMVVPTTDDEARVLVEDLTVLEAGIERRRDALRAYTKAVGPIAVNGVEAGHYTTETPRIPARKFVEWCEERGIDPFDYLALPVTEFRKLAKKRKTITELAEMETSTKFDTRRPHDIAKAS